MNLNDVVTLGVAIANLMLRVWEVRKGRRNESGGPDQLAD